MSVIKRNIGREITGKHVQSGGDMQRFTRGRIRTKAYLREGTTLKYRTFDERHKRRNVCVKAIPKYSAVQWTAVALGYSCILGSVFRCLPQIHRIFTRKSVEGISFTAVLAEFLVYTVNLAYNSYHRYPFNTYGDLAISWGFLILLMVLIQCFKRLDAISLTATIVLSASWCYYLLGNVIGPAQLAFLQGASSLGLALGSRIPQIWLNWKRRNTGELSIIMYIANVLGCLIRVFTTLALTRDVLLLLNAAFHGILNFIIVFQCVDTRWKANKAAAELSNS